MSQADRRADAGLNRRTLLRRGVRAAGALAVAGPAAQLLIGCGEEDEGAGSAGGNAAPSAPELTREQVAAATGTVKVLGWEWYEVPELESADVKARWGYLAANEDTITKTKQRGTYDLTTIVAAYQPQLRKVDRIRPFTAAALENFDGIDAVFRDARSIRDGDSVYGVPFQWGYGYLMWDERQTSQPKTLDDLRSPKLRKKVGIPDDPFAVITTFAILTGKKTPTQLTQAEFDDVMKTLAAFRPQLLTIHPYGEEPALMARGDMAVDFPAYGPAFLTAREGGAKTKIGLLGAFSYLDCMTLIDGANVPLAHRYTDQSLTVEAQRAVVKKGAAFPVLQEATDVIPEELRYTSATEIIEQAPLVPGVPADEAGGKVPFTAWVSAWEEFKSGVA